MTDPSFYQEWLEHLSAEKNRESRVVQELYREYRLIKDTRKLNLSIPVIQLFDSLTLWGQWNPMTRTILISRRLVSERSWYCVESILRHEMAHQWVNDVLGSSAGDHGEDFEFACRKLGVPPEFSRAGADVATL